MAKLTSETQKSNATTFEEAVSLTGFGRYNLFVILASGGCLMCVILETMGMMFVIPSAKCDLQLSLSMQGYLSSASFLGVVAGSHFWGFLADTRGRKRIILISMLGSNIITIISSLIAQDWVFILLRFLNGLIVGGSAGIVYAFAGEFHDNVYRPKIVSWMSGFVGVGNMVLSSLAWLILTSQWAIEIPFLGIDFKPWRLLVLAYGLPSIVFALLITTLPESPKFLLTQGKYDEALNILRKVFASNTGKSPDEYPVTEILWDEETEDKKEVGIFKAIWNQTVPLVQRPLIWKSLMVCGLQFGVFTVTSGLAMWYPEILNEMTVFNNDNPESTITVCSASHYNYMQAIIHQNDTMSESKQIVCGDSIEEDVFMISLMTGTFLTFMYIIMGSVVNILGKKALLLALFGITAVISISVQFVYGYTVIKVLMGLSLSSSVSIGVINAVVVDLYPTKVRGMALAISLMFGRIGAVTGSHVAGYIFYQFCDFMFIIFSADHIILMIVVCILLRSKPKSKAIETIT